MVGTTNMAHWIDTETQQIVANTLVDSRPRHAEFSHDGTQLWISSEIGGTVTVFDVASRAEIAKISFSLPNIRPERLQPVGMVFSADGAKIFVALGPSDHVAVIDAKTFQVIDYILVGRRVWHMALSPDGTQMFTTNGVSGDVTVFDVASHQAIRSIKVGRYPWGAAARPLP